MLARPSDELPRRAGYVFQPKWDGFRILARRRGERVDLVSRAGNHLGRHFPELVDELGAILPARTLIDGEIVAVSPHGLYFGALCRRLAGSGRGRPAPVMFAAFDLLELEGQDVRGWPLRARRAALSDLLALAAPLSAQVAAVLGQGAASGAPAPGRVFLTPETRSATVAAEWWAGLGGAGVEGVVAKRIDAPYRPGERGWLKVRRRRPLECVVAGYTPRGAGLEALVLALHDRRGRLGYIGRTTSLERRLGLALRVELRVLEGEDGVDGHRPGVGGRFPNDRGFLWTPLRPLVVAEVAVDGWDGPLIRHRARLLRFRPDRSPTDCRLVASPRPSPT